jgi:hypothetical protein
MKKYNKIVKRLKKMGYIPNDINPTVEQIKLFIYEFEG